MGFLGLAIVYMILGILIMNLLGINSLKASEKLLPEKNVIFAYLAAAISLFTLAIAFVLSNHKEIVSALWLFEATVLFWFFRVTKETKVYVAAIILMIIGLGKVSTLFDGIHPGEYKFLIPVGIILVSLFINLYLLKDETDETEGLGKRLAHDILHLIGIGMVAGLLSIIIISSGLGYNFFGMSLFVLLLSFLYTRFAKRAIMWMFGF